MDLIRLKCRKTLINFLKHISDVDQENNLAPLIFIEASISSLLSLITDVADYNNFGFQKVRPLVITEDFEERIESMICEFDLDSTLSNNSYTEYSLKCVYVCHPSLNSTCTIVKHIEVFSKLLKKGIHKEKINIYHYIGFVPFYSKAILRLLHQQLVSLDTYPECYSVNLFWVPIDESALSMEIKNTFLDFHVFKEESSLQLVAKSLYWLLKFSNSTSIPMFAIGSAAVTVLEHLFISIKEDKLIQNELKPFDWNCLNETDIDEDINLNKVGILEKDLLCNFPEFTQIYLENFNKKKDIGSKLKNEEEPYMSFDRVIIIDRRCDLVTPFATPFSYHALLDFLFGVQKTYVDIPTQIIPSDTQEKFLFWRLPLFGDPLFTILKDLKLKDVGIYLHQKANELQSLYQEKEKLKDISAIGDFVRKLKGKQHEQGTLAKHVNIATFLNEYFTKDHQTLSRLQLEDSIMSESPQSVSGVVKELSTKFTEAISLKSSGESPLEELLDQEDIPIEEIYRILCLSCVVENGFKNKKIFEKLKKHIVSVFGFEEMFRLNILDRVGLFKLDISNKSCWPLIKKSLNLFVDEEKSKDDISYVYSGYAPISVRLVEILCSQSYKDEETKSNVIRDILNNIWGPSVELLPSSFIEKQDKYLVVFIGGVTLGEIATLRKLQGIVGKEIYVATTDIINHKSFFESFKRPKSMIHLCKKENTKQGVF